jgi:hypothetical protein
VRRRWTGVAWSMVVLFVVGYGVGVPLSVANGKFGQDSSLLLAFAAFMVVGAIIVAHRPGNAVGWIFSAIGLLTAIGVLATEYAAYAARTRPGSPPGVVLAAWYSSWWWYPTLVLVLVFTPLVFPTGRLLSTRRRPVAVAAAVGTAVIITLSALQPTLQNEDDPVRNPIGLAGIPDPEEGALGAVLFGLLLVCAAAAAISVVLRFRRSQGVERQQLKWFTYAATLMVLFMLLSDYLLPQSGVVDAFYGFVVALVPVAAGVAVLRYRLYDIDRLINRTLVYGLLTALLGAGYAAAVLVLGQLFGGWVATRRVGRWPAPPWRWRRCSSRPGAAPKQWWTGASTGASTTRPTPSRRSPPTCATRSTWTPCQPNCWRWWTRPWSRPGSRCGFDRPPAASRVPLAVRYGLLPGRTEYAQSHLSPPLPGRSSVKHLSDGPLDRLGVSGG